MSPRRCPTFSRPLSAAADTWLWAHARAIQRPQSPTDALGHLPKFKGWREA